MQGGQHGDHPTGRDGRLGLGRDRSEGGRVYVHVCVIVIASDVCKSVQMRADGLSDAARQGYRDAGECFDAAGRGFDGRRATGGEEATTGA
jgi:hypothetical protein